MSLSNQLQFVTKFKVVIGMMNRGMVSENYGGKLSLALVLLMLLHILSPIVPSQELVQHPEHQMDVAKKPSYHRHSIGTYSGFLAHILIFQPTQPYYHLVYNRY